MSQIISEIEAEQLRDVVPKFSIGDTVVVRVKVKEGSRERLQSFEGVVIARRNRGLNSSFTVRKISHGEGVERVFQTHSPQIEDVTVSAGGTFGGQSSTTSAGAPGTPPRFARRSDLPVN